MGITPYRETTGYRYYEDIAPAGGKKVEKIDKETGKVYVGIGNDRQEAEENLDDD